MSEKASKFRGVGEGGPVEILHANHQWGGVDEGTHGGSVEVHGFYEHLGGERLKRGYLLIHEREDKEKILSGQDMIGVVSHEHEVAVGLNGTELGGEVKYLGGQDIESCPCWQL